MERLTIHRILVPTDLSGPARHALVYARLFAECFSAHIDVVHVDLVLPPMIFLETGSAIHGVLPRPEVKEDLAVRLRAAAVSILGTQVAFDVHVVEGAAFPMLVKTAEQLDSDLIIIGTRGLRGWRRTAFGSLTEELMHATDRPVLIVRNADETITPCVTRILCPVNMTEIAREALRAAASVTSQFGAELIVAHVVEDDREIADAQPLLRRWLDESGFTTTGWRELIVRGSAAERVLDCVEDLAVDLLVIGAQHRFFSDETVIGTTTERLLPFVRCPVLAVTRSAAANQIRSGIVPHVTSQSVGRADERKSS
jgi:nucleotide-binding universal stress UspA family protein